jgi:hypothetical protein
VRMRDDIFELIEIGEKKIVNSYFTETEEVLH